MVMSAVLTTWSLPVNTVFSQKTGRIPESLVAGMQCPGSDGDQEAQAKGIREALLSWQPRLSLLSVALSVCLFFL